MLEEAIMSWNADLANEVTQTKSHYTVQGHSGSPILARIRFPISD